ncbi:MAG: hypothetical protein WD648_10805 [Planctomycetaceae bacterium]
MVDGFDKAVLPTLLLITGLLGILVVATFDALRAANPDRRSGARKDVKSIRLRLAAIVQPELRFRRALAPKPPRACALPPPSSSENVSVYRRRRPRGHF